jgi:hypothetical protein
MLDRLTTTLLSFVLTCRLFCGPNSVIHLLEGCVPVFSHLETFEQSVDVFGGHLHNVPQDVMPRAFRLISRRA